MGFFDWFKKKDKEKESMALEDIKNKLVAFGTNFQKNYFELQKDLTKRLDVLRTRLDYLATDAGKKEFLEITTALKDIMQTLDSISSKNTINDKLSDILKEVKNSKIDVNSITTPIISKVNDFSKIQDSKFDDIKKSLKTNIEESTDDLNEQISKIEKSINPLLGKIKTIEDSLMNIEKALKENNKTFSINIKDKVIDNKQTADDIIKLSEYGIEIVKQLTEPAMYFAAYQKNIQTDWDNEQIIKKKDDELKELVKLKELNKKLEEENLQLKDKLKDAISIPNNSENTTEIQNETTVENTTNTSINGNNSNDSTNIAGISSTNENPDFSQNKIPEEIN